MVLALLLAALRGRSANLRYAAACAGMVIMLAISLTTYCLVPGEAGCELQVVRTLPGGAAGLAEQAASPSVVVPADPARVPERLAGPAQGHRSAPSGSRVPPEGDSYEGVAALMRRLSQALSPWMPSLATLWFVGATALSMWHVGGWIAV